MNPSYFKSLSATALVWCLCQLGASGAVVYDWQFPNNANPAQAGDAAATATITLGSAAAGYVNPATGWDVSSFWDLGSSGNVALSVPSTAGQSLEFMLTVRQYVLPGLWDGNLSYLVENGSQQGSFTPTAVTPVDVFGGRWYDYTTDWLVSSSPATETITIFGSPSGALINGIQLGVEPVPEPIAGVLCSCGVVIAAAMLHQRRRRRAEQPPVSR